jgi:hypothetical protein
MAMFPPEDAEFPEGGFSSSPPPTGNPPECTAPASVIHCQDQVLEESVAVTGTPWELLYRSDRVPGGGSEPLRLTLGTPEDLSTLPFVMVSAVFQPRLGEPERVAWPAGSVPLHYDWRWNSQEPFGRHAIGRTPVDVTLTYHYRCVYQPTDRFGYNGLGQIGITLTREVGVSDGLTFDAGTDFPPPPCTADLKQDLRGVATSLDYRTLGVGGWSLTPHHVYDVHRDMLLTGDGSELDANHLPYVTETYALTPWFGYNNPQDYGGSVEWRGQMAIAPDGSVYLTRGRHELMRIDPDGTQQQLGMPPFNCDTGTDTVASLHNRHVDEVRFCYINDIDVGRDGSVYLATGAGQRVRVLRINTQGIVHVIGGTNAVVPWFGLTNTPSASTPLKDVRGVRAAADGRIFFSTGAGATGGDYSADGRIRVSIKRDACSSNTPESSMGLDPLLPKAPTSPSSRWRSEAPSGTSARTARCTSARTCAASGVTPPTAR